MTTRKTLKEFFQSRGSSQNDISLTINDSDNNGEINQGDDLGKEPLSGEDLLGLNDNTTGMLGDYVNFIMSSYNHRNGTFNGNVANFYRPGPHNSRAPSSDRGNFVHDPKGADGSNIVFADPNISNSPANTLLRYSNSGYINNLDQIVKKEGSSDNNNLLYFETQPTLNTGETFINHQIVQDSILETLETFKGYNRYHPSKNAGDGVAYAEKYASTSETQNDSSIMLYSGLDSRELGELQTKNLFSIVPDLLKKYTGLGKDDIEGKSLSEIEEIVYNNNKKPDPISKDFKVNLQQSVPAGIRDSRYQQEKNDILDDERIRSIKSGDYSDLSEEDINYTIYLGSVRLKIIIELMIEFFDRDDNIGTIEKSGYIEKNRKLRGFSGIQGIIETTYKFSDCIDEGLKVLFKIKGKNFEINDSLSGKAIKDSKFFWVAMFKSVIKDSERLLNVLESGTSSKDFFEMFSISRLASFSNFIARIGDISLLKSNGDGLYVSTKEKITNPLDIDNLDDNIGNIHLKNKDKSGRISWNQGSTPSLYIMPGNIGNASMALGTGLTGVNPIKSALSGRLSGETVITPAEGDFAKIPSHLVEKLENQLEASYVPFYFHDLRTNEIISFHAFLNQLSDSFSPGVSPSSGFGRMDPVQIYRSTSRSLNVGFTIAATSKKDFNEMWWKINKLLTLIYPQWSKGTKVFDEISKSQFTQPFSQIIAASPMIRLRIGDVIKSNYSELALARKFGIGDFDTRISGRPGIPKIPGTAGAIASATSLIEKILGGAIMAAFGSPVGLIQFGLDAAEYGLRSVDTLGTDVAAEALNTQVASIGKKLAFNSVPTQNPLGKDLYNKFINPNTFGEEYGPKSGDRIIIAATLPDFPYYSENEKRYYHVQKSLTAEITKRQKINNIWHYFAIITDIDSPSGLINKEIILRFEDFIMSPEHTFLDFLYKQSEKLSFLKDPSSSLSEKEGAFLNQLGFEDNIINNPIRSILSSAIFMSPYSSAAGTAVSLASGGSTIATGNPFVRAFNSSKGRGLAGFINSFSIDLMPEDGSWEIDQNSRAPKLLKITFGFAVVHDITPGIDHSGFNTAPIYNVGDIMKSTSGDVWGSKGMGAQKSFKKSGDV